MPHGIIDQIQETIARILINPDQKNILLNQGTSITKLISFSALFLVYELKLPTCEVPPGRGGKVSVQRTHRHVADISSDDVLSRRKGFLPLVVLLPYERRTHFLLLLLSHPRGQVARCRLVVESDIGVRAHGRWDFVPRPRISPNFRFVWVTCRGLNGHRTQRG